MNILGLPPPWEHTLLFPVVESREQISKSENVVYICGYELEQHDRTSPCPSHLLSPFLVSREHILKGENIFESVGNAQFNNTFPGGLWIPVFEKKFGKLQGIGNLDIPPKFAMSGTRRYVGVWLYNFRHVGHVLTTFIPQVHACILQADLNLPQPAIIWYLYSPAPHILIRSHERNPAGNLRPIVFAAGQSWPSAFRGTIAPRRRVHNFIWANLGAGAR